MSRYNTMLPLVLLAAATARGGPWPTFHGDYSLSGYTTNALPAKLTQLWRAPIGSRVETPPVSDGTRLFAATTKGVLVALDMTGKTLWKRTLGGSTSTPPSSSPTRIAAPLLLSSSCLVAVTTKGRVYALGRETGATIWQVDTGERRVQGSPSVVDSSDEHQMVVVLGQENGALHAFDIADGSQTWTHAGIARCDGHLAATGETLVYGSCAAAFHIFNGSDGIHVRDIEVGEDCEMAGGTALARDHAYAGNRSGAIVGATLTTGRILWTNTDDQTEMFTTPAITDRWLVFASDDGIVKGLSKATGETLWQFRSAGLSARAPVIAGDKVLAALDGTLYLLDLNTGTRLWSYEISDGITGPSIVGDKVFVGSEDGHIWAFGPHSALQAKE